MKTYPCYVFLPGARRPRAASKLKKKKNQIGHNIKRFALSQNNLKRKDKNANIP